MSTNSGNAPACEIASVVAMNVCGTVNTTSPGCTPQAIIAKRKRIRAAADRNRMARVAESRKCLLKLLDHRAADEASRVQSSTKHAGEFLLKFYMRSNQVKKRNAVRSAIRMAL